MTGAMVDRLFWRAGFGPSASHRTTWTGRQVGELVDWLVSTPAEAPPAPTFADYAAYYAAHPRTPKDSVGDPIDPMASDRELELEWIDRMQRADNPLPDRLAFFWHRHWAISQDDGIPIVWVLKYRNQLLKYADFGRNPDVTFREFCIDMTTNNTAMSMYLNINQNVKGKPNENYAREFMELFCLGPKAPDGTDNYSQTDVAELSKAFTGWTYNGTASSPDYGKITFGPTRFEMPAKTLFTANPYSPQRIIPAATGSTNTTTNPANMQWGPTCVGLATDYVLAHGNHAQFLIRKLWAEFIASPIPQGTLDNLVAAYRSSGFKLKPLIRSILANPLIFESIDEPNLIKPPMIYIVGALRQMDAPLKDAQIEQAMNATQQKVYYPPNVSGWEGGLSWLNTNTVQGRFDLIGKLQYLKYSSYYPGGTNTAINYPDALLPAHQTTPNAQAWYDKAVETLNYPWISAATKALVLAYAGTALTSAANARRTRLYVLQALILGGPDGQVM